MKVRTSLTLSDDLLARIDEIAGENGNRSAIVEFLLRQALEREERRRMDALEAEALNRLADWLKEHGEDDWPDYQGDVFE